MPTTPIGPYPRLELAVRPWDPRAVEVAAAVDRLVRQRRPDLAVVHIGSTAVPDLPGKGVVDLGIHPPAVADVLAIERLLVELGFTRNRGPAAFPDSRPLLTGSLALDGAVFAIHLHVIPDDAEWQRHLAFRDALRADPAMREAYTERKRAIVAGGPASSLQYSFQKTAFIRGQLEAIGAAEPALAPGATVGILGGGQLGRMLALAARAMGYRVAILDPDPTCPAAGVADRLVVARYDDHEGALQLAAASDVVTYELEHVAAEVVGALEEIRPVRPSRFTLLMTQDRLAERRFLESLGIPVAPWREVRSRDQLSAAAAELVSGAAVGPGAEPVDHSAKGRPPALRLKVAIGGYDGRSQVRIADAADESLLDAAWASLGGAAASVGLVLELELTFAAECSVVIAGDTAGRHQAYPTTRNRHDDGILAESVVPMPGPRAISEAAQTLARRIAVGLDLEGVATVECFVLADGSLVVNEIAPRVHNSGHWTLEGARTDQFEQHIRAICGLPLGSVEVLAPAAAMVNLLGTGPDRPARLAGLPRALRDPGVSVHLYDKRRVFERRKMGHVTVIADSLGEAMARARAAAAALEWVDQDGESVP